MKKSPIASVVMSAYNGQEYLSYSIESVLNQTFKDFEFIIIDDGSVDKSSEIISRYKDTRIRFFKNYKNKGLPYSLNRGIKLSKGKYIVRMDQDDVCMSNRLQTQVDFMELHKDIDICGTAVTTKQNGKDKILISLSDPEVLKGTLLFRNILAHSSVIIRKQQLQKFGLLYDPNMKNAEDYDLWTRSCWNLKITNLKEPLIFYRKHENQMTKKPTLMPAVAIARKRFLERFVGKFNESEWDIHNRIATSNFDGSWQEINLIENWLEKILKMNHLKHLISEDAMETVINTQWFNSCSAASRLGFGIIIKYLFSPVSHNHLNNLSRIGVLTFQVLKNN